jgi:hypothetical protein
MVRFYATEDSQLHWKLPNRESANRISPRPRLGCILHFEAVTVSKQIELQQKIKKDSESLFLEPPMILRLGALSFLSQELNRLQKVQLF